MTTILILLFLFFTLAGVYDLLEKVNFRLKPTTVMDIQEVIIITMIMIIIIGFFVIAYQIHSYES